MEFPNAVRYPKHNVMIALEEQRLCPKILDFGIAKLTDPRDANLKLTERYHRTSADKIEFTMTFEDDAQWVQPWTVAYSVRPAEGELYEYACHEGNYGLRNILENARDADRAAAHKH